MALFRNLLQVNQKRSHDVIGEWRETKKKRLRDQIERTPELREFYEKLGYDPYAEQRFKQILNELRSLLRAEIADIAVFQKTVDQARADDSSKDPDLWKIVLSARNNPKKVKHLVKVLNDVYSEEWAGYRPLKDRLPFGFYELPFIVWTATDPRRFSLLLKEMSSVLEAYSFSAWKNPGEVRSECLGYVAKLNEGLKQNASDLWGTLCCLRDEIESSIDAGSRVNLDAFLWDLLCARDSGPHTDAFRESIQRLAKNYFCDHLLDIHTPWLTNRLITDLLNTVIEPVIHLNRLDDPGAFTSRLKPPWCIVVPRLLSFVFFIGSLSGIFVLFAMDLTWIGWLGVAYLTWHYFWRFRRIYLSDKVRLNLVEQAMSLSSIRNEIATGFYDPDEIAQQHRKFEGNVPSLVFSLLRVAGSISR